MDPLTSPAGVLDHTTEESAEAGLLRKPVEKAAKHYQTLLLLAVLAVVCAVVAHGIRRGEFDFNVDEAQHGVTGLFVADALHDMPVLHPVQYAYAYYAQYPSIAIVHWPPLFYLFEGLSFLILGPTVVAARLTILLFSALLCYQWFRLVEEWHGRWMAAVSAVFLCTLPMVLLFEKTVMLEIPSLALSVAAIRAWMQYLENGNRRAVYRFALWFSAAMLCKQTSVYVLVFCALSAVATRNWERLRRLDFFVAAGITALLVAPFYLIMLISHGASVAKDLGSHQMSGVERFLYFWRVLPATVTVPMLGLAGIGIVTAQRWSRRDRILMMACWIAAGYLTFTFFGQNEARFTVYWIPPLLYFATGVLMTGYRLPAIQTAMRAAAVAAVIFLTARAWAYERPYISGYETAAAQLIDTYHSGIVLFDGKIPGNFVFFMRSLDPRRQFLVLRKSLYVNDVRKNQNSEELAETSADVLKLFKDYGVRFAVVGENIPLDFRSQMTLRECLKTDQFELLGRFPIESNQPVWQGRSLLLYENKQWTPPAEKTLRIRMLTLSHDIVVPLDQFDFVHGSKALPQKGGQ